MPDRPKRIEQHVFTAQDRLFFDANVWVFLFGTHYRPTDRKVALYSSAFKKIQDTGCRIAVDVIVLSEFVNRQSRLAFHQLRPSAPAADFKPFRKSQAFRPIATTIADACRRILAISTPVETDFSQVDQAALLADYESGRCDFNDYLLARLCRRRGFTLVTDDGDFRGSQVPILTANPKLLH
jgi:predicted nucleic acid-binding protein